MYNTTIRGLAFLCMLAPGLYPILAQAELGCTAADTADLTPLVDELERLPEGSWFLANLNRYDESWSPLDLRPKPNGLKAEPSSLIKAWSSFAWDCRRGDLLLFGGGHANYAGNDTYRWRATTRLWERMSLPSEVMQDDFDNWLTVDGPFGSPIAAHTYENNIYLPYIDRFLVVGGSAWNNGGAWKFQDSPTTERKTGPYVFDPGKADGDKVGGYTGSHVQRVAPHPEIVGGEMWYNRDHYAFMAPDAIPEGFIGGASAYVGGHDRDVILLSAQSGGSAQSLYRYEITDPDDSSTDVVVKVGRFGSGVSGRGAGTYDPHLNIFVRTALGTKWSNYASSFYYWDLSTPGPDNRNVLFVPTDLSGEWILDRGYGLDYDPVRRQYLMWGGDANVWILRPPADVSPFGWTIEKAPPSATPDAPVFETESGGGVLGKWKYIPELDAFMGLQDAYAGNIWIYKPLGWRRPGTPAPPVVSLRAQPVQVVPGGSALLTWNVDGADTCTAFGAWSGAKATSGSQSTGPLNATTEFGLNCVGPGGETARTVEIRVELPPPTIAAVAGDGCVNSNEANAGLTVSGSALAGAIVNVVVGQVVLDVQADANGAWSVRLSPEESVALPEGGLTIRASQEDAGGIVSAERIVTVQKDTVPPSGTPSVPDLVSNSDSGSSSADGITNDKTPTMQGTAPPSASVRLLANGTELLTTLARSSGTWKATTTKLSDGRYDFQSALLDTCGNVGGLSGTAVVIVDSTRPALTVSPVAVDNRVNALETAEGIVVNGSSEAGASVVLTISAGSSTLLVRDGEGASPWSVALSTADLDALIEGKLTFKTVATDVAGNKRTVSRSVVKDTEAAAPVILPVTGDDLVTEEERSSTIGVSGTTEPYATVTVRIDTWTKSVKAASSGAWVASLTSSNSRAFPLGVLEVSAVATDLAGNVSAETVRTITNQ